MSRLQVAEAKRSAIVDLALLLVFDDLFGIHGPVEMDDLLLGEQQILRTFKLLGISRPTLHTRIDKYNLKSPCHCINKLRQK